MTFKRSVEISTLSGKSGVLTVSCLDLSAQSDATSDVSTNLQENVNAADKRTAVRQH
jgi:hypothetical protein